MKNSSPHKLFLSKVRLNLSETNNFIYYQTVVKFKIDKRNGQVFYDKAFTRPILDSEKPKKKKNTSTELLLDEIQEELM